MSVNDNVNIAQYLGIDTRTIKSFIIKDLIEGGTLKDAVVNDFISNFNKDLPTLGKSKSVITIHEDLSFEEEQNLRRNFPEFEINFSKSNKVSHSYCAASRKLELQILLKKINVDFNKTDEILVSDIGGNFSNHYIHERKFVHSISPILDAYDDQRFTARISAIEKHNYNNRKISVFKKSITDFINDKTKFYREHPNLCFNKCSECKFKTPYAIMLHSNYDISLPELAETMSRKSIKELYGCFIWDPVILIKNKGYIKSLNVYYEYDNDYIKFSFENDSSFIYKHKLVNYLAYVFVTQFIDVNTDHRYYLEFLENRNGIQFYKITASLLNKTGQLTRNIWFNTSKKVVVRYPKFITFPDADLKWTDLFKVLMNKFKSAKINDIYSGDMYNSFVVDSELVDKGIEFALRTHPDKFKPSEIYSYLQSVNRRWYVGGVEVASKPEVENPSHLYITANMIYLYVYVFKYDIGKMIQKSTKDIATLRDYMPLSIWEKLNYESEENMMNELTRQNHWFSFRKFFHVKLYNDTKKNINIDFYKSIVKHFRFIEVGEKNEVLMFLSKIFNNFHNKSHHIKSDNNVGMSYEEMFKKYVNEKEIIPDSDIDFEICNALSSQSICVIDLTDKSNDEIKSVLDHSTKNLSYISGTYNGENYKCAPLAKSRCYYNSVLYFCDHDVSYLELDCMLSDMVSSGILKYDKYYKKFLNKSDKSFADFKIFDYLSKLFNVRIIVHSEIYMNYLVFGNYENTIHLLHTYNHIDPLMCDTKINLHYSHVKICQKITKSKSVFLKFFKKHEPCKEAVAMNNVNLTDSLDNLIDMIRCENDDCNFHNYMRSNSDSQLESIDDNIQKESTKNNIDAGNEFDIQKESAQITLVEQYDIINGFVPVPSTSGYAYKRVITYEDYELSSDAGLESESTISYSDTELNDVPKSEGHEQENLTQLSDSEEQKFSDTDEHSIYYDVCVSRRELNYAVIDDYRKCIDNILTSIKDPDKFYNSVHSQKLKVNVDISKKCSKYKYINRSAYKLVEIITKFGIDFSGKKVLDMCGAPGGFLQVILEYTKNVKSFSKYSMGRYDSRFVGSGHIYNQDIMNHIHADTNYDIITADGAVENSYQDNKIFSKQFFQASRLLRKGGTLIIKHSNYYKLNLDDITGYKNIYLFKPIASSITNTELYLICVDRCICDPVYYDAFSIRMSAMVQLCLNFTCLPTMCNDEIDRFTSSKNFYEDFVTDLTLTIDVIVALNKKYNLNLNFDNYIISDNCIEVDNHVFTTDIEINKKNVIYITDSSKSFPDKKCVSLHHNRRFYVFWSNIFQNHHEYCDMFQEYFSYSDGNSELFEPLDKLISILNDETIICVEKPDKTIPIQSYNVIKNLTDNYLNASSISINIIGGKVFMAVVNGRSIFSYKDCFSRFTKLIDVICDNRLAMMNKNLPRLYAYELNAIVPYYTGISPVQYIHKKFISPVYIDVILASEHHVDINDNKVVIRVDIKNVDKLTEDINFKSLFDKYICGIITYDDTNFAKHNVIAIVSKICKVIYLYPLINDTYIDNKVVMSEVLSDTHTKYDYAISEIRKLWLRSKTMVEHNLKMPYIEFMNVGKNCGFANTSIGVIDLHTGTFLKKPYRQEESYDMGYDGHGLVSISCNNGRFHAKTNSRYVMVCKDTAFLSGPLLYDATENYEHNDFNVKMISGAPGCGKSTYIIENINMGDENTFGDMCLTSTKEASYDLRDRIKKRNRYDDNFLRRKFRTGDSFLLNGTDHCDTLWVDEAFMEHPGKILLYAYKSKCRNLILLGDQAQIPFINRDCQISTRFHDYNMFGFDISYRYISYRCPRDVIALINNMRMYTFKVYGTNNVEFSLKYQIIHSKSDIKFNNKSQILTFTQAEKAELISDGRFSHANVNTIHEYQGNQRADIILVRTQSKPMEIFNSANHILVALTRHTQNFIYYSYVTDKTIELIEKSKSLDKSVFYKRDHSVGMQTEYNKVEFEYIFQPELGIDDVKHDKLARNIVFSNTNTSYYPARLVPLFDIRENYRIDYNVASVIPNDYNYLQDVYDTLLPGNSEYDRYIENYIIENEDVYIPDCEFILKLKARNFGDYSDKYLTPILRTSIQQKVDITPQQIIRAFSARNGGAPLFESAAHEEKLFSDILDKFRETYIEDKEAYDSFKYHPVEINSVDIEEWFRTQPTDIKNVLSSKSLYLDDFDLNTFFFSIKRTVKPNLELNAINKILAPQTIACHEKLVNTIWSPLVQILQQRLTSVMKKNFIFFNKMSVKEFEELMSHRMPPQLLKFYKYVSENDASKFDKSQMLRLLKLECRMLRILGMKSDLVDWWLWSRVVSYLIDFTTGFKGTVEYQRKSGDAMTLFGNTLIIMMIMCYLLDLSEAFGLFCGDDSYLWSKKFQNLVGVFESFALLFNLEMKMINKTTPYFCSKFIIPYDENQWRVVPDIVKVITKLGRMDLVNYDHVEQFRISYKDNMQSYRCALVCLRAEQCVLDRYNVFVDMMSVISTLFYYLDSKENFSKLFYAKPSYKDTSNGPLPKLDI